MPKNERRLELIHHRRSKSRWSIVVRMDGDTIHQDVLDLEKAEKRKWFIEVITKKYPGLDSMDLENQLLEIAAIVTQQSSSLVANDTEIDVCRVVRPELFFTPELAGLTVSVACQVENKIFGKWKTYRHWLDGKRDVVELADSFELPTQKRLWIYPQPAEPNASQISGWSASAREDWLRGELNPDPIKVFKSICERISYFLDFSPETQKGTVSTIALWIMFTYCYPAWASVPYIYIGGPMNSGKSRLLELLGRMVFRPIETANTTAACLFRSLHDAGGVLLYDEAEKLKQSTPDMVDLNGMLLKGYQRGAKATRLEPKGDSYRSVSFDIFGPKALACIAGVSPTLMSRCIPVMMFRALEGSIKPSRRIDQNPEIWKSIRDNLHAMALNFAFEWAGLSIQNNVCPIGISNRNYEIWQPILSIAGWLDELGLNGLFSLVRTHAVDVVDESKDDSLPEADEQLLEILAELIQQGQRPIPSEILNEAKKRDEVTFKLWHPGTVTKRLKLYGIPKPAKINGERRHRSESVLPQLIKVQRNYGIELGLIDESGKHSESTLTDPQLPHAAAT